MKGAVAGGYGDDAARFYAAEAAKVIQAFFHAAALTGRTLDHVLRWVAHPSIASEPLSSPTAMQGPIGANVSNPLPRVYWPSARWMSRAML